MKTSIKIFSIVLIMFIALISYYFYSSNNANTINNNDTRVEVDYDLDDELIVNWGDYQFSKIKNFDSEYFLHKKSLINNSEELLIKRLKSDDESELDYMYLYNDSLYIVVSGYFSGSYVYYLETPDSEPVDISPADSSPNQLTLQDGKLILREGSGDECGAYTNYYVLENKTDFVFRASSDAACSAGAEVIGFYESNFIYSDVFDPDDSSVGDEFYINLYLINIDNPDQKTTLVENFPENINYIYFEDQNNLILNGKEDKYRYNLSTQALTEI